MFSGVSLSHNLSPLAISPLIGLFFILLARLFFHVYFNQLCGITINGDACASILYETCFGGSAAGIDSGPGTAVGGGDVVSTYITFEYKFFVN